MHEPEDDCDRSLSFDAQFPHRSWLNNVALAISDVLPLLLAWVVSFCSVWTVISAPLFLIADEDSLSVVRKHSLSIIAVVSIASLLVAIIARVRAHVDAVPEGLGQYPGHVRRIAQLRPIKWEWKLAQQLLAIECGPLEREFSRLETGLAVVPAKRLETVSEYMAWSRNRTDTELRLIKAAFELFSVRLPTAITSTAERAASPRGIVEAVDEVRCFYASVLEHERDAYAVVPPATTERLHQLHKGRVWEFRRKLHEVFGNLKILEELDPESEELTTLSVQFDALPKTAEMIEEIERLMGIEQA